jgi:hypothetical protein
MRRGLILLAAAVMCAGASSPAGAQSWNIQIVDDAGTTGYHSRVVATSDGTPYIFYLGNNSYLTMAWWVSGGAETGGWDRDVLSYQDIYRHGIDMEVDPSDEIHVAFSKSTGGYGLLYGIFDPATKSWSLAPEVLTSDVGHVSLALRDSSGTIIPSLAYSAAATPYELYVATRDPDLGTWNLQVVYDDYHTDRPSIAVDSAGKLHVSFYEYTGKNLMYATNASGAWVSEYVDVAGSVGEFSAIVVDAGDIPYIVYYDETNTDLKYAKLDNS